MDENLNTWAQEMRLDPLGAGTLDIEYTEAGLTTRAEQSSLPTHIYLHKLGMHLQQTLSPDVVAMTNGRCDKHLGSM